MAPVPDGGETPAAGAEALITISTLSQRVALKSGGFFGHIAMKGLSEVLLEHKQRRGMSHNPSKRARANYHCCYNPLARPSPPSELANNNNQNARVPRCLPACNQDGAEGPNVLEELMMNLSEAGAPTLAHFGVLARSLDSVQVAALRAPLPEQPDLAVVVSYSLSVIPPSCFFF